MPEALTLINPEYQRALKAVMEKCAVLYVNQTNSFFMKNLWEILMNTTFKSNHELKTALNKYTSTLKPGLLHFSEEAKAKSFLKRSLRSVQAKFSNYNLLIFERDLLINYIIELKQSENYLIHSQKNKEELERVRAELSTSQEMVRKQNDIIIELRNANSQLQIKNRVLTEQVEQLQTTVEGHDKTIKQLSQYFHVLVGYLLDPKRKDIAKLDILPLSTDQTAIPSCDLESSEDSSSTTGAYF